MREAVLVPLSYLVVAAQCFLGMALLLGDTPHFALPLSIAALVVFSSATIRGHFVNQVDDCGCYGGLVRLSVAQSLLLDASLAALLTLDYILTLRSQMLPPLSLSLRWIIIGAVSGLFGAASALSHRYYLKHDKLFLNLSRLRVGRSWQDSWLERPTNLSLTTGTSVVVFMGSQCSVCKSWVNVLNAMHSIPKLPKVAAIIAVGHPREEENLGGKLGIQFPFQVFPRRVITRLARSPLPLTLLIEDGEILGKWTRRLPESLIDALKEELHKGAAKAGLQPASLHE